MYSNQQKSASDYTLSNQQLKSQQYNGYVSSVSGHNQLARPVLSSVHGEENPYLADRQLFNQDKNKFQQPNGIDKGEGSYHSLFSINTPNLEQSSGQYHAYFDINTPQQFQQQPQQQFQQQQSQPQFQQQQPQPQFQQQQPQQQFQQQQQPHQQFQPQQQPFQQFQQQQQPQQQFQQQQQQFQQQPQQQQSKPIWQLQQTDQSSWKPQQQDLIFNRTMDMGGNKQPGGYNPSFMDRHV